MITVYGIPNCDSVKRARAWLTEQGLAYQFHDFKKAGVPPEALAAWCEQLGWERVLNRAGTTWRKLDEATRNGVVDKASAQALLLTQASAIKRPVLQWADGRLSIGFSAELFSSHL
ncbi:ArsC family reductase [Roseateles oligotrophus]|uniref:ArsC family reductase n=1 Tax=Roseateles oligotrophus TaxID=1769250 RepID=A0ABT2YB84_9BURK|nr:ArsC family reductase [Roseateles oligotrophus]MCV2367554.1 ArsC family reductase [Roseateles oligotrophus]